MTMGRDFGHSESRAEATRFCRVMLAGEDSPLRQRLHEAGSRAGLAIDLATTGALTIEQAREGSSDVVVILSDFADFSASELVRSLRQEGPVGIIVVSTEADATDRIIHLELGADDVVSGETQSRELLARIRNLFRRLTPAAAPTRSRRAFRFSGWTLNPQLRQLTAPHNAPVHLTSREYEVLETLLEHANEVVSRDDLRGTGPAHQDSRAIDALIARLRRKLHDSDEVARMIRPVRNVGYILARPVEMLAA